MTPSFFYSTNEGKGAWEEAITFLKKQKPIAPLNLHTGLSKASIEHVVDLAKNNKTGIIFLYLGHTGSDGSTTKQRIQKYNKYTTGGIGENVAQEFNYKGRDHALETIISLIIDDGVSNRGHR
jgi:uncharacterized protein YkwD